jgi:hypothetical protein
MSRFVPLVQSSDNMALTYETINDYVENSLFDDIQDFVDSTGHAGQNSSGYGEQLHSLESCQVIEDEHGTATINDEKQTTKDKNISESHKPDILYLVDEVFSDIQNHENNKQTQFNIPSSKQYNQRLSAVSKKVQQNNHKVCSDEDRNCFEFEGAIAILSPARSSVIVSDKMIKLASQKPSADLCPICGALAGKHR